MPASDPVGVVGLGRLGVPVVEHLLGAGYQVGGYDINADRCAQAASLGVDVHAGPYDLAAATGMSLVLVGDDDDVLDACIRGEDALVAGTTARVPQPARSRQKSVAEERNDR